MTIQDRDKGARRLIAVYGEMRKGDRAAEVGVIGARSQVEESAGITVADVATWAEYGLGQPQRSWLRDWVDGHQAQINARLTTELRHVHEGKQTRDQALARLGVWIAGELQKNIANGIAPANAQSTIDRKGSSVPLIDKGQFRQAITSRVGTGTDQ